MDKIKLLSQNSDQIYKASSKVRAFLAELLDEKSLVETDFFLAGKNFLDGTDALGEGVVTGYASIGGKPVYLFAQNSEVLSGSLSLAQAEKIVKNMRAARKAGIPFISIIDSAGARIGEGISVAEGYAKLIREASFIKDSVPHIAVIKGNCVGLMSAFAGVADFIVADEKAKLSVNSPTVAAAASKGSVEVLSAKSIAEKGPGVAFTFKDTAGLKQILSELFGILSEEKIDYTDDLNRRADNLNVLSDAEAALRATVDDGKLSELYPDFAKEVKTAFGRIAGTAAAFIAFDESANGFVTLNGLKKLSKFVGLASLFGLPLVNFVDCKGIEPSIDGELSGLTGEAAGLLHALASYNGAMFSVITGSAIGFAYTAFASKALGYDYVLATVNSVVSPVNPEVATVIMYDEELKKSQDPVAKRAELNKKYAEESANPYIAAKDGFIDNIIEPSMIRPYLTSAIVISE